ncbi:4'-phosphopantetheinyl transferase superfamily protein [Microbacterium sp. 18062]|uniref:4'-phosphopantetheinyl transferase superfamily protein n=1 Tax=Microbacterium sp. 18062 TaxID=2681410 RepID=UPI001358EEDB|nr:4'-phosphopantetheinyl transferase superfamily protein [Microbacterium sp. 18062]
MSVHGIGVDLASVARLDRLRARDTAWRRWFSAAERMRCAEAPHPDRRAAEIFAAKEATFKALALAPWDGRVPWAWIDTAPIGTGRLAVRLSGPVAAAAGDRLHIEVSVASDERVATAFAIALADDAAPARDAR